MRSTLIFAAWVTCLALASGILGAPGVWAQAEVEVSPADQQAIRKVIQSQIEAFRRDDAAAAFALASPGIQERFGSAALFIEMVRSAYEPVYRPRQFRFLETARVEGQVVQKVILIGPDGLAVLALYPMVRLKDGTWRTDGCYLVPMEAKDA